MALMHPQIEELERVLREIWKALPSLTSTTTIQSVLYHETYIQILNALEEWEELKRLFAICEWTYYGVDKGGIGVGWLCDHNFFMSTLNDRSLTNIEKYHKDYLERHHEKVHTC